MTRFPNLSLFAWCFLLLLGCSRGGGGDAPFIPSNNDASFVLAETHAIYQQNYLYPEDLPNSLEAFAGPADYVQFVNNQRLLPNDRFSSYLTAQAFSEFNSTIFDGRAFIGLQFTPHTGVISAGNPLTISTITPFSRAYYDAILAGDRLLEVDGITVNGMTFEQVRSLLPTLENEPVSLRLQRGETEVVISTSAENSVDLVVDVAQGIGYISLRTFSNNTLSVVFGDVQALRGQGITKLILDVRGNSGGSVNGVRDLLNYFIPVDGLLLYSFQDKNAVQTSQLTGAFTERETLFDETNMVILADEGSLSASELLVNALKFYQEASFIGVQTGGKGVAQGIFSLSDGSGTVVVNRRILGPDNQEYHLEGISPNFQSVLLSTPVPGNDSQLEDAIDFLTN